ncbi:MAG: hypothetical protein QOF23_286 [Solirubrobacterales bacterium]|nr:hypothetical protein [Solirubrobacterales bacterium]
MRPVVAILRAVALASVGAGLLGLAWPAAAGATDPRVPENLTVIGEEGEWHSDTVFQLTWDPPGGSTNLPAHYLVRDALGNVVVPPAQIPWSEDHSGNVHVPRIPGRYTVEVWLEDGTGPGSHASSTLLFDDTRPAPARALAPGGWIAGGVAVILHIEHPPGPLPLSGIRGYAVSVDADPNGSPCAGADRCTLAETALAAGIGDDAIALGVLPQGTSIAHVVAVSGSGMRSPQVSSVELHVDATRPDVTLAGVPAWWEDGPVRVLATATDALSGMEPSGPGGPFTAIAVDGSTPTVAAGPSVAATVTGDGVHSVVFYARDAAGNTGDGQRGSDPPRSALVRIDSSPPRVAFSATRDPAEPERLEALVSDPLSGPGVGAGSISVRPAGSHLRFTPLPTSGSGNRLVARWNSDAYPAGSYEFRATGFDRAGNSSVSDRRTDGARMVLANPLKAPTELLLAPEGKRAAPRRYGARARVGGRLTLTSGSALASRPVELVETFAPGAAIAERTTTVITARDGSFEARLAPGPSRSVEARFAGDRLLTRAGSSRLGLTFPAGMRLRASRATAVVGGAPVRFSGRVGSLGARIPRAGLAVELEFRAAGLPWSEFRTVQSDRRGRFSYRYAFADDDSRGVRFQFRARLPAQEDWPYGPGASRAVVVSGR